ncbi:MAG: D-arabinono-1,4-lactone oxidase [Acidimicrobiales bacterium]
MPKLPDRPVWSNWAGNQRCSPAEIVHPAGTDEVVEVVKQAAAAGRRVKVVGSGHSFTDAAITDGTLVQLDRHERLLGLDREKLQVTVQAGIPLSTLNETLAHHGLALPNLGDIEYQTVSGALSTGTHGTGAKLGCLATAIVGIELVTADGSVLHLSADEDPAAFSAARVSVGALGAISSLTLQCVPAFNLHAVEGPLLLEEAIEQFDALADGNDHFEFYWMPYSRWVITKRNNRVDGPEEPRSRYREWFDDSFFQNTLFGVLGKVQVRRPSWVKTINRAIPKPSTIDYVQRSDRVFTSPRRVRFCEMEYGFPREHAREVIGEVRDFLLSSGLNIGFPIEVRVTAADDIPLSMTSGRSSAFIACHVFKGQPYEQYFRGVERIISQVGGRPHWGKLHFQTAETLGPRYPKWDEFQQVRHRLDPEGRFANAYTERVFGP